MPLYLRYFLAKIKRTVDRWAPTAFAAFMVLAAGMWALGISRASLLSVTPQPVKDAAHGVVNQILRWARRVEDSPFLVYRFRSQPLPVFDLVISEKRLDKLDEYFTAHESEDGRQKIYKNAKFTADGQEYDVKVSYRGDENIHFVNEKKSWRIKFSKDHYFRGMKSVNLIIPEDRLFLGEFFNDYRARKLGIPVPKDDFAVLRINGRLAGVYFMIEQWNSQLLEKDELNSDANLYGEHGFGTNALYYEISGWQKYSENPTQGSGDYTELAALLNMLQNPSDEYFWRNIPTILDMDEFMRWQVHSALSGSPHQDAIHNARLYFDPTIGKFKFLPWDVYIRPLDYSGNADFADFFDYNPLVQRILENPEYLDQRNRMLWQYVSDEKNLQDDLAWYDRQYDRTRIAFYQDTAKLYTNWFFRSSAAETRNLIAADFRGLRQALERAELSAAVSVNLPARDNTLTGTPIALALDLSVKSMAPQRADRIEIKGLPKGGSVSVYADLNQNGILDPADRLLWHGDRGADDVFSRSGSDLQLSARGVFRKTSEDAGYGLNRTVLEPGKTRMFVLAGDNAVSTASAKADNKAKVPPVSARVGFVNGITGTPSQVSSDRFVDQSRFERLDEPGEAIEEFLAKNPMFFKAGPDTVRVSGGVHVVSRTAIIPRGLSVEIDPGAAFLLGKGVSIVSHSPVRAEGTAAEPISFSRLDPDHAWGSLAIIGPGPKSVIRYARFSGGSTSYVNGLFTSGTLSVYSAPVEFTDSEISGAGGDDGINVKNAEAAVLRNRFVKNSSDAIDFDFVRGVVAQNLFVENGNDAVDISGSRVLIRSNAMVGNGDKGVSVGENSHPDIVNNIMVKGNIGIAVKDQSDAFIAQNTIVGNKSGIELYQKKQVFGGGSANVYNTIVWGNASVISLDPHSSIAVRGSDIERGKDGFRVAEVASGGSVGTTTDADAEIRGRAVTSERIFSIDPRFADADAMNYELAGVSENRPLLQEGFRGAIQGNTGSYDLSGRIGAASVSFFEHP